MTQLRTYEDYKIERRALQGMSWQAAVRSRRWRTVFLVSRRSILYSGYGLRMIA